ncbi:MAG: NAD(P)/FAD-dependent oxidoreductase [Oscillospiraceae bacterium]
MKKVVIIGAGPAGITAGLELIRKAKDEYSVTILEETSEIGGISRTVNHNGNRMDIGGHRFFSKDERVNEWWNSILKVQSEESVDNNAMLIRRRVSRIYYKKKFFDYPISIKMQTILNLGMAKTLKAGFSYLHSIAFKKEETSLENFYINRFGKELYSIFFEDYTEKLWGRHPSEISADWGAQRVKGLSIIAILKDMLIPKSKKTEVETSLIEEFKYPKFGPGQLWEKAAAEFESLGGQIIKNIKVTSIETADNQVIGVKGQQIDGEKSLPGDIFISSMPIKDLINAFPQKNVPNEIEKIANGLPYRDFVTVGLLLDKILLKNETDIKTINNIVPDCWIYVQDRGVKLGRIQIFNNWSPYMVKDIKKTIWIGLEYFCNEGDEFWESTDLQLCEVAKAELKKIGVIAPDANVLDFHIERVKKAYPAYFDTYDEIPKVIEFLNGFENLYCIGRNGQHRYNNMDHSMITAFETVDAICSGNKDKQQIWNVNTDKKYHEGKQL